jgi:hypothetical protein
VAEGPARSSALHVRVLRAEETGIRLIDRGFTRRVCFEGTKGCGDPRSSRSIQVKVNELLRSSSVLHCPVVTLLAPPR